MKSEIILQLSENQYVLDNNYLLAGDETNIGKVIEAPLLFANEGKIGFLYKFKKN